MPKKLFDAKDFSRQVRERLAARRIGMRAAAAEIGCSKATVSRVANGKEPDVENYLRILQWLVGGHRCAAGAGDCGWGVAGAFVQVTRPVPLPPPPAVIETKE